MNEFSDVINIEALTAWMNDSGLGDGPISDAALLAGGTQNFLLKFNRDGRDYVLRRPPKHLRKNSNQTMLREARVLDALAGSDVPHPGFIAACNDESVLGACFYLMEPVDGFNAANGLPEYHRSEAAIRHRMGLAMVEGIASLSALDYQAIGLEDFGKPDGFLERQVPRWLSQLKSYSQLDGWPGIATLPGMDDVIPYWLEANRPTSFTPGIMHGDFHTANVMFRHDSLRGKGLIYEGVLEPPKGKKPEDWEPREQTLFKSTEHGDDVDRPVMKSDGSWTYFAPDIAYHYDKVSRGFDALIDVFGADHGGYVKRMKAAVSALSGGKVPLDIKLTQLVKLYKNGEPFKMSKRAGTFVTLSDVVDQVGPDVTRFHMLTRRNDAPLDFDFDKVLEQSRENPVFYVQYAHARVTSVLRKAQEAGTVVDDVTLATADLSKITHESELTLAAKLAEWPRLVETAARANEPHRIAFSLYELAADFHALWNRGNDLPELRFLQDDRAASQSKIALARACAVVIATGLGILGVKPAEELR